jgi:hypothetical protein
VRYPRIGLVLDQTGQAWSSTVGGLTARSRPIVEVRTALQLQIIAPSSLLSHSGPDLQLLEFCISLQLFAPMQAHLSAPSGVSKQLKVAQPLSVTGIAPALMSPFICRGAIYGVLTLFLFRSPILYDFSSGIGENVS